MFDNQLAATYVRYSNQWFFVSTIDRESSAAEAYGMTYAETMAWEVNRETGERGRTVAQSEALPGSINEHQRIVEQLREHGEVSES